MGETYDYAKLGQTAWHVALFFDNGHEAFADEVHGPELPNLGLAKAWVNRSLSVQEIPVGDAWPPLSAHWWGRVERGSYVDESFDHDGEHVLDAQWVKDDTTSGAEWFAALAANRVDVIWSES